MTAGACVGDLAGGFEVVAVTADAVSIVGPPNGKPIMVPRPRWAEHVALVASRRAKNSSRGTFTPVAISLTDAEVAS